MQHHIHGKDWEDLWIWTKRLQKTIFQMKLKNLLGKIMNSKRSNNY
jgi:hypothetical protein